MRSLFRNYARPQALTTLRLQRRVAAGAQGLCGESTGLGPLETKLLESLWAHGYPLTVRCLQRYCPGLAYTTILTTLDRLHRKGLVLRRREGRAFAYAPRCTRDQLLSELICSHVARLVGASEEGGIVLSTLVRAVGRADARLLDELDALVQAERSRLKRPEQ